MRPVKWKDQVGLPCLSRDIPRFYSLSFPSTATILGSCLNYFNSLLINLWTSTLSLQYILHIIARMTSCFSDSNILGLDFGKSNYSWSLGKSFNMVYKDTPVLAPTYLSTPLVLAFSQSLILIFLPPQVSVLFPLSEMCFSVPPLHQITPIWPSELSLHRKTLTCWLCPSHTTRHLSWTSTVLPSHWMV